jgi:hypothetical protein
VPEARDARWAPVAPAFTPERNPDLAMRLHPPVPLSHGGEGSCRARLIDLGPDLGVGNSDASRFRENEREGIRVAFRPQVDRLPRHGSSSPLRSRLERRTARDQNAGHEKCPQPPRSRGDL